MKERKEILKVQNVEKAFTNAHKQKMPVLKNINLQIKDNEIIALLGKSGSGKSTLLRIISGLIEPDSGSITCCELPVEGPGNNTSMVFQSFALFPWLNVFQSVALGLQAQGLPRNEVDWRTMEMLDLIGLADYASVYPRELSGGMRQRVGFARALAVEPALLLLDEPFSALDIFTGNKLRNDLLALWENKEIKTRAMLLVTHDVEEAVMLCDRVCLLSSHPGTITESFDITPKRKDRTKQNITPLVEEISKALTELIAAHP